MVPLPVHHFPEIILLQCLLYVVLAIYCFFLLFAFNPFLFLYLYANLIRCQPLKPFLLFGRVVLFLFGVLGGMKVESISNIIDEVLKLFIILMPFLQRLDQLYISNILTDGSLVLQLVFVYLHLTLGYLLLWHPFLLFLLLFLTFILLFLLLLMFFHLASNPLLFGVILIQLVIFL